MQHRHHFSCTGIGSPIYTADSSAFARLFEQPNYIQSQFKCKALQDIHVLRTANCPFIFEGIQKNPNRLLSFLCDRKGYIIPREFLLRGEGDDAQICASSNFASKLPNKSVNLPPLKSLKRGETGNSNLNQVNNDFP